MEILNQPIDGQLGQRLIEILEQPEFEELQIIVAFAKDSGVLRLRHALEAFRLRGGRISAYVGIDLNGTSYEALTNMRVSVDELHLVHSENSQTFHSKIYNFKGPEKSLVIIGSNNLTGGGLWTNFESAALIPVIHGADNSSSVQMDVDEYIRKLAALEESLMTVTSQEDLDLLHNQGYIQKEIFQKIQLGKSDSSRENSRKLFGKGVSVRLPDLASPHKKKLKLDSNQASTSSTTSVHESIWFETKALTGGSRNILDLSMTSLIESGSPKGTSFDFGDPRLMQGGVTFFGIDPLAKSSFVDVAINFEGETYYGNTILFPSGANSNGTWRIQVKGISSTGLKITEAFKRKGTGYFLVNKILTFTKIENNLYSLSVTEESELANFKAASRILARNGSSRRSKYMGLL